MRNIRVLVLRWSARILLSLSFVLSIAAAGLWYAGFHSHPNSSFELEKTLIEVQLRDGHIIYERTFDWPGYSILGMDKPLEFDPADIKRGFGVTYIPGHPVFYQIYSPTLEGLGVVHGGGTIISDSRSPLRAYKMIFPAWYPLGLVSLPLLVYLLIQGVKTPRRIIQRRRSSRGLCLNCGYDIRESMDRCPECGVAFVLPDRSSNL
jgi:hypothetical protein